MAARKQAAAPEPDEERILPLGLMLDGKPYALSDLSYREQREVREKMRESTGNPNVTFGDVMMGLVDDMDLVPALVWAIKKRDDPQFSYEQADDLKPGAVKTLNEAFEAGELPPDWPAEAGS